MPDTVVPKTQTTSPLAARFQGFSPRWSAMWVPYHCKPWPRRYQTGGIAPCKGATRRRHAARGLRMAQNPHRYQCRARCRGGRARMGHRWVAETRQLHTRKVPRRNKSRPARAARSHFRYKTLPAHPKWLDLALFRHAGRVLYRSHHQKAEQGEFCTERGAEMGLANTTGHQAPPVWRTSEGPVWRVPKGSVWRARAGFEAQSLAAVPVGGGGPGRSIHKQQQRPAQTNFACNSPTTRIDTRSKTAEYQRSDFNS